MSKKNEVAVIEQDMSIFEDAEESGFEEMEADDFQIPFLSVIQSGSPELKSSKSQYDPEASEGRLVNKGTGELYAPPVHLIPCYWKRRFVEWLPKNQGFVAEHITAQGLPIVAQDGYNEILENGNILSETYYYYCLQMEGDFLSMVILAMSKSNRKAAKTWNTIASGIRLPAKEGGTFRPPLFSHVYELSTVAKSNELGEWLVYKLRKVGPSTPEQFAAAKEFRLLATSGETTVDHAQEEGSQNSDEEAL